MKFDLYDARFYAIIFALSITTLLTYAGYASPCRLHMAIVLLCLFAGLIAIFHHDQI